MPDHSAADTQIIALLAKLQASLGADFTQLDRLEVSDLREILKYQKTLIQIARYEEAKGLFWAHWRGVILGAAAILSALAVFWSNSERLLKALGKLIS